MMLMQSVPLAKRASKDADSKNRLWVSQCYASAFGTVCVKYFETNYRGNWCVLAVYGQDLVAQPKVAQSKIDVDKRES